MAYKSLRMDLILKIIELHSKGVPIKRIARIMGCSKNTIKKYLRQNAAHEAQDLDDDNQPPEADKIHVLNELLPHIHRELSRRGVTRLLLWEEYMAKHPDGLSYGRFCDRIRKYCKIQNATIRLQHRPAVIRSEEHTSELQSRETLV